MTMGRDIMFRKKTSRFACFSLIFLLLGVTFSNLVSESCGFYILLKKCLILFVSAISLSLAFISIWQIEKRKKILKGKTLAVLVALISLLLFFTVLMQRRIRSIPYPMLCAEQLRNLGLSMAVYVEENSGRYPTADKWCDLLLENTNITDDDFLCPSTFWPVGSYGFNRSLDGKSINEVLPDTVLLFEVEYGKNISGGPELVASNKHYNDWTNILFADYHVNFIDRKDVEKLRWNVPIQKDPNEPNFPDLVEK